MGSSISYFIVLSLITIIYLLRKRENEIFSGYIRLYHPLREIKEKHDEQSSYGIFVHTKQKGDIQIFKNSKIYKAFKDWT